MNQTIITVASYGGPYAGNFIPSLRAFDLAAKEKGYRVVYVFPDFVKAFSWTTKLKEFTETVYFIPYNPYSIQNVLALRRIIEKEKGTYIYSRMSGWELTVRFANWRIPNLWHMEMGLNLDTWQQFLKYWIKYHVLGFGKTYHVAASESTTKNINRLSPRNMCVWIPNAINLERLSIVEHQAGTVPFKLLVFAYDPIVKGFDIVLDACHILNTESREYELYASAQVHTYKYLNERYGEKLPDWLHVCEPTDDISSLYGMVDVMVNSSRSEGLSYANLEALYTGLPLVFSDIPGNSVDRQFMASFPFQAGDPISLAEAIRMARSQYITHDDAKYNRGIIRRLFSMDEWVHKILSCIIDMEAGEDNLKR